MVILQSLVDALESLLPGFLKIKKDVAQNDQLWFDVLSQSFTSGALVQAVMETVENWKDIREEFWMGKMLLWLATQPNSMYHLYVNFAAVGSKVYRKLVINSKVKISPPQDKAVVYTCVQEELVCVSDF
jgi:hypothetical protein